MTNASHFSVTVYAATANGNATPIQTISGPSTALDVPYDVALDTSGNIYVANAGNNGSEPGSVTVYAAGASGDVAPISTIAGSSTGIDSPQGIALDASGNIYVANYNASTITVYAAGANGNVAPINTIAGSNTGLFQPTGLVLDSSGNLYVPNVEGANSRVTVYTAGVTGNASPLQTIRGMRTRLDDPYQVGLDSSANIYVANAVNTPRDRSVSEYPNGADGNLKPTRIIAGATSKLDGPDGVALDTSGNIYVANAGRGRNANTITIYAPGTIRHAAPIRTISGSNTALSDPEGIAIQ